MNFNNDLKTLISLCDSDIKKNEAKIREMLSKDHSSLLLLNLPKKAFFDLTEYFEGFFSNPDECVKIIEVSLIERLRISVDNEEKSEVYKILSRYPIKIFKMIEPVSKILVKNIVFDIIYEKYTIYDRNFVPFREYLCDDSRFLKTRICNIIKKSSSYDTEKLIEILHDNVIVYKLIICEVGWKMFCNIFMNEFEHRIGINVSIPLIYDAMKTNSLKELFQYQNQKLVESFKSAILSIIISDVYNTEYLHIGSDILVERDINFLKLFKNEHSVVYTINLIIKKYPHKSYDISNIIFDSKLIYLIKNQIEKVNLPSKIVSKNIVKLSKKDLNLTCELVKRVFIDDEDSLAIGLSIKNEIWQYKESFFELIKNGFLSSQHVLTETVKNLKLFEIFCEYMFVKYIDENIKFSAIHDRLLFFIIDLITAEKYITAFHVITEITKKLCADRDSLLKEIFSNLIHIDLSVLNRADSTFIRLFILSCLNTHPFRKSVANIKERVLNQTDAYWKKIFWILWKSVENESLFVVRLNIFVDYAETGERLPFLKPR